ncbi:hypothetical protein MVEN_01059200 [Mycena venus]|uniref:Dipeptidyl-peptidase V n=1 Tax=Mycena venus TaxID=2733690 RepID=A0A8H6Y5N6_9AGAR|nr:hypothetical protein MVEN_01059200 [Mycena venus]
MPPYDYGELEFTQPAKQIKAFNMGPVPQRIFDDMRKYEDSNRGFTFICFEKLSDGDHSGHVIVSHRPADSQISEFWRMNLDPQDTNLERISYFDLGSGRTLASFCPIPGEDWRGFWRRGGAILAMDLDGNEYSQLWRYWEDSQSTTALPPIEGELQNEPGGRIERLTHDSFKYSNVVVSDSNKIMAFVSNKENGTDLLVYVTELTDSRTVNATLFIYPEAHPEQIILPNTTEKPEETAYHQPTFSRDPAKPHLIYLISNAYGDFHSVLAYDRASGIVVHVTTPEPDLRALRPINWPCMNLRVTTDYIYFRANADGYTNLFVWPLSGPLKDTIVEIKPEWEGGQFSYHVNSANGRPHELVLGLVSHLSSSSLAYLDIKGRLEDVKRDDSGGAYVSVPLARYTQAVPIPPAYRTLPARLLRFKSFDGLEIPCMYYHPNDSKSVVPAVISIHGGPEGQSTSNSRSPIHWYIMNELGYAIIYPNVRGSNGYGKRFMALDDVEKREDSVKDIGALLDHIEHTMKNELDPSRIAVIGGSYGGYMTLACMIHFPTKFACGLANFPVAHWPSFLENTAPVRRAHRRGGAPLQIAHGDTDSRIPVDQAIRMWETVLKSGVHSELMVCAKEGHGFKQKSVIEYTNAAKLHFLERFLPVAK